MKKKILILYAPYGSGHKSIANHIGNFFIEKDEFEVKVLDIAKYANLVGRVSIKLFDYVINHRKKRLYSLVYEAFDNKIGSINQMNVAKKTFDNEKLRKEIVDFNPDLTISTHFFCGNIIAYYNKKEYTHSKMVTVITDYVSHSFWRKYHKLQDAFIVGNDIVKKEMVKKGIDENKIYSFGLPFDKNKLSNIVSKDDIFKKYHFDKNLRTYLFFSGGSNGSNANYDYLKALIKKDFPINIIFVSGNNKYLENKCRSYISKNKIKNVKILGFVNDVYSLLNASDVVITKPGGATVTECLVMKVPVILIPGNGGPENYNARFICKNKYGTNTKTMYGFIKAVKKTVKDPDIIDIWTNNLNKVTPNESTTKIYNLCAKLLKQKNKDY